MCGFSPASLWTGPHRLHRCNGCDWGTPSRVPLSSPIQWLRLGDSTSKSGDSLWTESHCLHRYKYCEWGLPPRLAHIILYVADDGAPAVRPNIVLGTRCPNGARTTQKQMKTKTRTTFITVLGDFWKFGSKRDRWCGPWFQTGPLVRRVWLKLCSCWSSQAQHPGRQLHGKL